MSLRLLLLAFTKTEKTERYKGAKIRMYFVIPVNFVMEARFGCTRAHQETMLRTRPAVGSYNAAR